MGQIVIRLEPTAVPGQLKPEVDLVDFPAASPVEAWQRAVEVLVYSVQLAFQQYRQVSQGSAGRVILADTLPMGGPH